MENNILLKNKKIISATALATLVVFGGQDSYSNESILSRINELQYKSELKEENYLPRDYIFLSDSDTFSDSQKADLLVNLVRSFVDEIEDLPPDISRDIDEHFSELF